MAHTHTLLVSSLSSVLWSVPFRAQVDLVITWLNSTAPTWRDAVKRFKPSDPDGSPLFNPNGDDLSDTFMELKYSLRSYEQHGLLAR